MTDVIALLALRVPYQRFVACSSSFQLTGKRFLPSNARFAL
jgi:hypothetical protein